VVDVGTGSGCIAVALALVLSDATIIATDRSSAALTLAQHNAAKHGVTQRIEWLEGDCLEPLKAGTAAHSVDLIAANPPYIPERDWASLQPEVRLFEPRMALVGGEDGMELHGRLLRDAPEFLRDNGLLIMEIGEGQGPALRRLAEQVGAYAPLRVLPDAAGIERVVIAQRVG
jgi:release factor glutamine methyltransferase